MNVKKFSDLMTLIMEACSGRTPWDDLASELAKTFKAQSCCYHIRDAVGGLVSVVGQSPNLDSALLSAYEARLHKSDLMANQLLKLHPNQPVIGSELLGERDFIASSFYQDFCAPQRMFHVLGSTQDISENFIGILRLYRPQTDEPFDAKDKAQLALILPHLKSAIAIDTRLRTLTHGQQVAHSVIDQLSLGVAIIGAGSAIYSVNETFERALAADFGISLRNGRLQIDDAQIQQSLQKAIERAYETGHGTMLPIRDKRDRPISLTVLPMTAKEKYYRSIGAIATILINNPDERRRPKLEGIASLYGLTPAEARLARALLEGSRLQDYAEKTKISLHTAKTQLKQIFQKTGHNRQGDLVRDIMSNPLLRIRL